MIDVDPNLLHQQSNNLKLTPLHCIEQGSLLFFIEQLEISFEFIEKSKGLQVGANSGDMRNVKSIFDALIYNILLIM